MYEEEGKYILGLDVSTKLLYISVYLFKNSVWKIKFIFMV